MAFLLPNLFSAIFYGHFVPLCVLFQRQTAVSCCSAPFSGFNAGLCLVKWSDVLEEVYNGKVKWSESSPE